MLPETSAAYYEQQQTISGLTASSVARLWRRMGSDFDSSWAAIRPKMLQLVHAGQLAAATASVGYIPNVLAETGQDGGDPAGAIDPAAFAITASDGRDLGSLFDEAPVIAKAGVGSGFDVDEALQRAGRFATMATLTQVADASREYLAADMGVRPQVTGYVRMLNPPSCSRCIVLAGKWFRWNEGFQRHPRCDCRHIPSAEDRAGDLATDPYLYFRSLSQREQAQTFGSSEARALRDGGDIYRIVNTRNRGLAVAGSKQAIRYGSPTRVTVDQIYRTAGTRTNAIRMLREHGYITGEQVRGGNILGQREGFGQLGKGGVAAEASKAVTRARLEGRDPLNRYTMSTAERRLYDAKARLDAAEKQGIWLRSIGNNDADRYNKPTPVTPGQLATLRKAYANEVAKLTPRRDSRGRIIRTAAPASVQRLAQLLGIS